MKNCQVGPLGPHNNNEGLNRTERKLKEFRVTLNQTESNRTEISLNRTELNRTEIPLNRNISKPNRAEPNRAEPNRTESKLIKI
jgi:hypothetical protein